MRRIYWFQITDFFDNLIEAAAKPLEIALKVIFLALCLGLLALMLWATGEVAGLQSATEVWPLLKEVGFALTHPDATEEYGLYLVFATMIFMDVLLIIGTMWLWRTLFFQPPPS